MVTKRIKGVSAFLALLLVPFFLLCAGMNDLAAAKKAKSCTTSKCHSKMGKEKYIHGPVASGACTLCHEAIGRHKFKPIKKDVSSLCYQCHSNVATHNVVHPPVQQGRCTGCHDAHQSPYQFQLRGEGEELCFLCHDKSIMGGDTIHTPVAAGGCSVCHNPHSSDFPRMLMAEGNEVCFTCHTDKAEDLKNSKFVHGPAEDSCLNCHSPHSGNFTANLAVDGRRDLCFTCHTDKEEHLAQVSTKHGGLETESLCLACHDPHATNFAKQLIKKPIDLCLGCHDREYTHAKTKVANMKALLAYNSDHHGPIRQGDCSACHNPHGSNNFRMLREFFPPVFYAPYDPENYKLCFMCHENTLAKNSTTTTLTNFRNGDQNLHYKHVNKAIKGRTCRACHDAHATRNPKHIRDAVPFGKWSLPINYTKNDKGGQCLPGCHKLYKYNREKAVKNK